MKERGEGRGKTVSGDIGRGERKEGVKDGGGEYKNARHV